MKGDPAKKAKLDALAAGAKEAEADPERHRKEAAVLATVAAKGRADPELWSGFTVLTWSRADHEAIAAAIWSCFLDEVEVHSDTVKKRLPKDAATIAPEVLAGILDGSKAVDVTVARDYMKTLGELDRIRQAEAAVRDFESVIGEAKRAQDAGKLEDAFGRLTGAVLDIGKTRGLVREAESESEAVPAFMVALGKRRMDKSREYTGLDCGIPHLNKSMNGLGEGLFIFAGAPSCGKTTFLKQIADHVADAEKVPVLFFSYEQSAAALRMKSLARLSRTDSWKVPKGLTDQEWEAYEAASEKYMTGAGRFLKIIEAGRDDSIERIRARVLIAKRRAEAAGSAGDKPPVMVVIDYLQLLPAVDPLSGRAFSSVREKIDFLCSELRRLARDLKSPVLAISSESREAFKENKKPTLAVFKESGGIEYSADAAFALWEDFEESGHLTEQGKEAGQPDRRRVVLFRLKHRDGSIGKTKMDFIPAWALFENIQEDRGDPLSRKDVLNG